MTPTPTPTLHFSGVQGHAAPINGLPVVAVLYDDRPYPGVPMASRTYLPARDAVRRAVDDLLGKEFPGARIVAINGEMPLSDDDKARYIERVRDCLDGRYSLGVYNYPATPGNARNLVLYGNRHTRPERVRAHRRLLTTADWHRRGLIDLAMPSLYVVGDVAKHTTMTEPAAWSAVADWATETCEALGLPMLPFLSDRYGGSPNPDAPRLAAPTARAVAAFARTHGGVLWGRPDAASPLVTALSRELSLEVVGTLEAK